jgi:pimeloyl-ACP methyl ester carboxylesterase
MAKRVEAPREQLVTVWGGDVTFQVFSAGKGPDLVYFHSFHERGGWSPFLAEMARRHTVYAPVHPGVARSTGVERLDDHVDLILAYDELLAALGLRAAHLVGHFFGAMVAAEIAAVFPARARTLVMASPLGLWRDDAPSADVLILPAEELAVTLWKDPGSQAALAWATLPATEAENVEAQIESIARRAAMGKFVWPIPDRGLTKRLHRIAAPTLILWGDEDRVNPVVYAEEWQRRIKGAALQLLPGGHMLIHESPLVTADVVRRFIG